MTEQERFSAYMLEKYNSDVVWHEGNPIKAMDLMLWLAWQAATQREGFKFVPVDLIERCISHVGIASCHPSNNLEDEQKMDADIDALEKTMIGAVDD